MLTCSLIGRLGNNLHLIAGTLGVAARREECVVLPFDWPYRAYFNIPERFFGDPVGAQDAQEVCGLPSSKREFMQCISLWWDIREKVWDFFQPSDLAMASIQRPQGDIVLHVRRGDYLTLVPDFYVPLWETRYYPYALAGFESEPTAVFSDDPQYCRDRWPAMKEVSSGTDWIDLLSMAQYSKVITANSSFSWWSAFLSKDPSPTCPRQWFGPRVRDQGWDENDFLPSTWRILDVE